MGIFCLMIRIWVTESHKKKYESGQKGLSDKAAVTWTGEAY
jgi:hypothetical protein